MPGKISPMFQVIPCYMDRTFPPCEFDRLTFIGGPFIYSLKFQTLVSPPAEPGG